MVLSTQSNIGSTGQDLMFRFSEISALLQGRLTTAEINDLLAGLLVKSTVDIRPGNLITAEWAMGVIRRLERLEAGGLQTLPINNKALVCLMDTANAYDGLLTKGVFIPAEGSVPIRAILQMNAVLQRVIVFSLAGMSMVTIADDTTLIDVFQRLYDAQQDLVTLFSSSLLGTSAFDQRNLFAKLLKFQLDEDQVNGLTSLRTALNQQDMNAAIAAQNRVNGISMEQSGDVTLGNLHVIYQGSNDGESLKVPDSVPYSFNFRVFNKTNRKVDVQVSAGFRQPRQAWSDFVQISGAKLLKDLIPFDTSNPTNPNAFRDIEVVVTTPDEAIVGGEYFLELTAQIPAPISLGDIGFVKLKGDIQRRPPTVNWVRFENQPFLVAGNPAGAVQDQQVSFRFSYAFHATSGQTTRKFRVIIDITGVASGTSLFDIDMSAGQSGPTPVLDKTNSTQVKRVSQPFDLVSDQSGSFQIDVWPSAGSTGKTLTYSVSLDSIDGALKPDSAQNVTIIAV